jgi:hypothetical protein
MKYLLWYQNIPPNKITRLHAGERMLLIGKNGQPHSWIFYRSKVEEYWESRYNLPRFNFLKALYYRFLIWWNK